jgi:methylenetetrahydrofolate reductase (NADPH)
MKADISFEFFPPKTEEGIIKLREARKQLALMQPKFFSVTFGAGGSTKDRTMETVLEIQSEGFEAAPHISGISSTKQEIKDLLQTYQSNGIRRLVVLRGDLPSGEVSVGDFAHANQLVSFIREQTGMTFEIEVAAYPETHPEARSASQDLQHFKSKVDAGANAAITQYFYNADAYFQFVERCESLGITIPIVPGIMPIYNFTQLARFSNVCGAEIPRWLSLRLQDYGDDIASLRALGIDVVTGLCEKLLAGGAPGLHFYTMNQSGIISQITNNLGLKQS